MSFRSRHCILCLTANVIGTLLLASINYALTPISLHLLLSGLYVPFPALTLPLSTGLLCVFLTGLWLDVLLPLPFGASATFFALSFTLVFYLRSYLRWEHNLHFVPLALILNVFYSLFLFFCSGSYLDGTGIASAYWARGATDLLASSLALLLVGGWFYHFQRALLSAAGIDLASELREVPSFEDS